MQSWQMHVDLQLEALNQERIRERTHLASKLFQAGLVDVLILSLAEVEHWRKEQQHSTCIRPCIKSHIIINFVSETTQLDLGTSELFVHIK